MISPIKIFGKSIGGENRSRVGIGWKPEPASQSQDGQTELGASQIGELSHAVNRRRVKPLVFTRSSQIPLENIEPVPVLLFRSVRLAVLPLEEREVVLRSEPRVVV